MTRKRTNLHLSLICCLLAFFSSVLQAFGMYNIHAVSGVTEGGVLGATLLLDHWLGISPAVTGFLLNAACYLLGWNTLGRNFIAYSLIASAGFSVGYGICGLFPPSGRKSPHSRCWLPFWGLSSSASAPASASGQEGPPAATTPWP